MNWGLKGLKGLVYGSGATLGVQTLVLVDNLQVCICSSNV